MSKSIQHDHNTQSPHMLMAHIAAGSQIFRMCTNWDSGRSPLNVVTYGIRDKSTVVHIMRSHREHIGFQVEQLENFSAKNAYNQGKEILASML